MKASQPYKYITAVKNGKHYVVFDFKDREGKRKRKWVNTELPEKCTKKALKEAVENIVEEFDKSITEGGVVIHDKKTPYAVLSDTNISQQPLGEFFSDWLAYIKPNVARTTHLCYRRTADRYLEYINENYPGLTLGAVNHNHIQNYLNYKLDKGVKGSSAKQYYLALHSAFAHAVKMELIPKHPMDKLVVPRADRHEATFYNSDELNELFEVFKGDKLELVVHIAAYYGLRRCEILGLRWDAIDFKNKTITIQRKIVSDYDDEGKMKLYVETRLKTNSTRRTLPLIPHIEELLLEKKKMETQFKKTCGKSYNKEFDGFICRDNLGNMIAPNYVTQHFHYIITKNEMKHLRFHDLRHSCASLLLANDIPMKAIQEWLGHSNFAITIPVPNSNTKPKQYLPTIILISKRRFSRPYARNLHHFFQKITPHNEQSVQKSKEKHSAERPSEQRNIQFFTQRHTESDRRIKSVSQIQIRQCEHNILFSDLFFQTIILSL